MKKEQPLQNGNKIVIAARDVRRVLRTAQRKNFSATKEWEMLVSRAVKLLLDKYPCGIKSSRNAIHYAKTWWDTVCNLPHNPRLKKKITAVKEDLWKEFAYLVYKERFIALKALIQASGVNKINMRWIEDHDEVSCLILQRRFRKNNRPDNDFIRRKLGLPLKQWSYEEHAPRTMEKIKTATLRELKKWDPEIFGPKWIHLKTGIGIYGVAKNTGEKYPYRKFFARLLASLPEKYRMRWKPRREFLTYAEAVIRLRKKIRQKQLTEIGPTTLRKLDRSAFRVVAKRMKRKEGKIVWNPFVDKLADSQKMMWSEQGSFERYEKYRDEKELWDVLQKHSTSWYTIVSYALIEKAEKEIAREIVVDPIRLAQAGNTAAFEMIASDLLYVCEDWAKDPRNKLYRMRNAYDTMKSVIKRCVYNYDLQHEGNFFSYLFLSLQYSGQNMRKNKVFNDDRAPD